MPPFVTEDAFLPHKKSSSTSDSHTFDLSAYLQSLSLSAREAITHPRSDMSKRSIEIGKSDIKSGLLAVRTTIPSSTGRPNYAGAINPAEMNMKGIQAIFALIGVSFVLGGIWFFFWAKNGGFKFRKGDWDEYKSTVLRRRGPNGTTLSNATKSTRLGGGSVVGEGYSDRDTYADETNSVYTGTMTELSSSTAPIIKEKQSKTKKAKSNKEETAKDRKKREMREAGYEGANDADVRAYMREKPARVGGINITGDTLRYGTDYSNTDASVSYAASHLGSQPPRQSQSEQPPAPPMHQSSPHYHRNMDQDHSRHSSRAPSPEKQATRNAKNGRRDFSYTINSQREQEQFTVAPSDRSASPPTLRVPAAAAYNHPPAYPAAHQPTNRYSPVRPNAPGAYAPSVSSYTSHGTGYTKPLSELQQHNTRAYHHPIPGLSGGNAARQGGFRRGVGTELDD